MKKAFFLGVNLLGDLLCTTPAVRSFRLRHPGVHITYIVHNATYCRVLDGNPDIDQVLYSERLYLEGEGIFGDEWIRSLPLDVRERSLLYRFNIHEVCRTSPSVFDDHIAVAFGNFIGVPVENVRPVVRVTAEDMRAAEGYLRGKPHIVLSMHSTSKVVDTRGRVGEKSWPADRWLRLANEASSAGYDVIAIGSESDRQLTSADFRNLYGLPIKTVAALLQTAACVIAVESGITHLCHAVDAPMVIIFSKHVPVAWANPREATRAVLIHDHPLRISCRRVLAGMRTVLGGAAAPQGRKATAIASSL